MRKVKLLALLLAALMVVTAFAGCANTTEIQGEVDGLESRVEALEGAIGNVQGSVDGLEDSVAGIGSSIAGNNDAIKDVADALAGLKDQINELEKPVDTDPVDTEKAPAETEAPAGDSADALRAKANELGLKIGEIQGTLRVDEKHYADADYVAALQAVTAAQTAISACKTVAEMEAEYAKLETELAKYVRVDTKFYQLYTELKGNYTGDEACLIKVDEAIAAYEDAAEHYADKGVTDWDEYGKDENGKKILLSDLKTDIDSWEGEYEWVADEADRLSDLIEDIEIGDSYNDLRTNIGQPYRAWLKRANALSTALVSLVSNYADYETALAVAEVSDDAKNDLSYLTVADWDSDGEVDLFDNYTELKAAGKHLVFVLRNGDELVETADVYANIVAAINAWAAEYNLDAKTAEHLVNQKFGGSTADAKYFYATFLNEKAFVEDMAAKSVEFKDTLAKSIKALNSKRMINVKEDFVKAYEANTKAIEDWYKACYDAYVKALDEAVAADKIVGNKTKVVAKEAYKAVFEKNFNEMVVAADLGRYCKAHKAYTFNTTVDLTLDDHKDDAACVDVLYTAGLDYDSDFVALYDFVEGDKMTKFLTTTYSDASALADKINKAIADWDIAGEKTVWTFLNTVGGYHTKVTETVDGVTYTYLRANATVDKTKETVAAYMALYGKGGDHTGNADLSALVDTDAYKAAIEALKAHLNKIDAATAELNEAYVALLGDGAEAVITTVNKGKVAALSGKLDAWKKVAGREDSERVEVIGTKNGHEEYELINIVNDYEALKNNNFKAVIAGLENRVNQLNNQIKALKSLYAALDKVNAFSKITIDSLGSANTSLKGSNYAATGIAMTEKDSNKKYDWVVSYITYDLEKHEFVVEETSAVYGTNDTHKEAAALEEAVAKFSDVYDGRTDFAGVTFSSVEFTWDGEMFKVDDLITIATNLYNKVLVNNFGAKDTDLENAKKSFVGYEFANVVATVMSKLNGVATVTDAEKKAVKTSANLAELKNVLVSIDENSNFEDIKFAGYTFLDMQAVNDVFTLAGDTEAVIDLLDKADIEVEVDETTGAIVAVEGVDVAETVVWAN